MNNPKAVIVSAVCGFVLSFLAGLISHVTFGMILIRAALFAAVFVAVSVLVSYLYKHFLADDDVDNLNQPSTHEKTAGPKPGSVVDITIDDAEIPQDENGPQFFVGKNHDMLRSGDFETVQKHMPAPKEKEPVREEGVPVKNGTDSRSFENLSDTENSSVKTGFVPVTLGTPITNVSDSDSSEKNDSVIAKDSVDTMDAPVEDLDELPDISELISDSNETIPDEDKVISDSDFALHGEKTSQTSPSVNTGKPAETKDAAVMAQAIRTILAKDEQ